MKKASYAASLVAILLTSIIVGVSTAQLDTGTSSLTSPHPDFSITTSPNMFNLHPIENASANIILRSIGGFSGEFTLTAIISPAMRSPPTISLAPSTLHLKSGATANSTLSIFVGSQTGLLTYNVTVTAQSDKISHAAQVSVSVSPPPEFTITLQPIAETVAQGSIRGSSYTLTSFFGFSGNVSINVAGVPPNVGVTVQTPPPLRPAGNFTGGISINVGRNAVPGTYLISFAGRSGSISDTATMTLTVSSSPVPDFTLTASPSFLFIPRSTGLVNVTLSSVGGFNGTVSLSSSVIPTVTGGPRTTLSSTSVTLVSGGSSVTVLLRILTNATTTTGAYNYTVTGNSGSLSHTAVGAFTVTGSSPTPNFSISANPSSLTIPQGSSNRIFLNLTSLNGFTGTINLSATVSLTGPRLVLGTTSVPLNAGGTTQVVLAVFANATVPPAPGSYVITATGISGNLTHSVNIQLTITSSSASLVLVSYSFLPTNVTLQLRNQGGGTVSLDAYQAGDSSGDNWTRAGWPGPTLNPNATVQALVAIGVSCPSCTYTGVAGRFTQFVPGNSYVVTVIGSNGQAFSFALTYSSAREALSLEGFSFFSGTNVTLFIRNFGNVSVSFVSYYVKDAAGDQYALTSWLGPTISPGALGSPEILVGSSCPGCTLIGNPFTFTPGQTYTVVLVTSRNNQFSFTITR